MFELTLDDIFYDDATSIRLQKAFSREGILTDCTSREKAIISETMFALKGILERKRIVNNAAQMFVSDLFGKLRERGIDLRSGRTVFVGGGSILLRKQIEASGKVASPIFVDRISANAKGYEMLHRASGARG